MTWAFFIQAPSSSFPITIKTRSFKIIIINRFKIWRLVLVAYCGCFCLFHHLSVVSGFSILSAASSKMNQLSPQQQNEVLPRKASATAAPLYITIGPPCAGKSTWIRYNGSPPPRAQDASGVITNGPEKKPSATINIRDVALDDQVGVWNPIPTTLFLELKKYNVDNDPILKTIKFGQTIGARIQKDEEMRLIAQRCAEQLSPEEFGNALSLLYNNNNCGGNCAVPAPSPPSHIVSTVLDCYESVWKQHKEKSTCDAAAAVKVAPSVLGEATNSEGAKTTTELKARGPATVDKLYPNTTDLYISVAIFRPHDNPELNHHCSGLQSALHILSNTPLNQPVAWGNTNTQCKDYKEALLIAARQGRPVHFVLYNASSDVQEYYYYQNNNNNNNNATSSSLSTTAAVIVPSELESIGFPGLLSNNLKRYLETGRYIPARAIWLMVQRTCSLMEAVAQAWNKNQEAKSSPLPQPSSPTTTNDMSSFERDQILVSLAGGMEMKSDRTIMSIPQIATTLSSSSPLRHHARRERPDANDDNRNNYGSGNWSNKRHRGMNHASNYGSRHNGGGRGGGCGG